MKRFYTLILIAGLAYLCSCSNNSNTVVTPKADSVSNGSYINMNLRPDTADSFKVYDYTLNKTPVYKIYGEKSVVYNITDTQYVMKIQLTDYRSSKVALNLTAYRRSTVDTGDYFVNTNTSTLTDFTKGENKTYAIALDTGVLAHATLHLSTGTYPLKGTFSLRLRYNYDTSRATGRFVIYQALAN